MRIPKKEKNYIWLISGILGILVFGTTILNMIYFKTELALTIDDLLVLSLVVTIFPPAIANFLDQRWRDEVDRRIPEFLADVSQAGRTGVTLTRAIELSAKRKYGPLSSQLNRVVTLISWGKSLEEAMKEFANEVNTRLARRTSILVEECNRSGGNTQEILEVMSGHISELHNIENERKGMIRPYVAIIYIAYFIFIAIDVMLVRTFFSQILDLQGSMAEAGTALLSGSMDLGEMQRSMFHLVIIEAFFGGLIAGKMGEASTEAGLKHSLVLIVTGFLIFYLMIWYPII
jgi:flagellar protein FlaJ